MKYLETNLLTRLDIAATSMKEFLSNFSKSNTLEEFLFKRFIAVVYAHLITDFFNNLNKKVLKELDLPSGNITIIKSHLKSTLTETRKAQRLHTSLVDAEYYEKFKVQIKKQYPRFDKLISVVENKFNNPELRSYLLSVKRNIGSEVTPNSDPQMGLVTTFTESFVNERKKLPTNKQIVKTLKKLYSLTKKILEGFAQQLIAQSS